MALLLTGLPGIGKTTVLREVAATLGGCHVRGFTTEEIRRHGRRLGFGIESIDGRSATLAHVDFPKRHRVGRYGVDLQALEQMVARTLSLDPPADVYLIDEIGKMECLSPGFVRAVTGLLDTRRRLVATVALKGGGFIAAVKRRSDAEVWEVDAANRQLMPRRVLDWLGLDD